MRLDGYIRVSRVGGREGENFIAPDVQRDRITAYAAAYGHDVVHWEQDLDETGGRMERPGFERVMDRIRTGKTDGIIVARLDRFARTNVGAHQAVVEIERHGAVLISVAEQIDSGTVAGRFVRAIFFAQAEMERERIREGWAAAQERAVDRGVHITARVPAGYKRGPGGRLELDEDAAPVVRDVFRQRAQGAPFSTLARLLEDGGVKSSAGSPRWMVSSVQKLLANPVYTGEARHGAKRNADAHPAIVTQAEWRAAQAAKSVRPLRTDGGALLAGLARCEACGYVLKPAATRIGGEKVRTYRCRGDHATGACPAPCMVLAGKLEPFVVERFLDALGPRGVLAQPVATSAERDDARRALEDAEAEFEYWIHHMSPRDLGDDAYRTGADTRRNRVRDAQDALDALDGGGHDLPPAAELRDAWPTLTIAERRRLLAAGVDAVLVRRGRDLAGRVRVLWHGEAGVDARRHGGRVLLAADDPVGAGMAVA
jgi:site-specific DNA recombinase